MKSPVRLQALIIHYSKPDAESVVNILRKRGINVRHSLASHTYEIFDALSKNQWDCIIYLTSSQVPSLPAIVSLLKKTQNDTSIIVINEIYSRETALKQIAEGALEIISQNEPEELFRAVTRTLEFNHLLTESLRLNKSQIECNNRFTTLLQSTIEAIAYVHEGAIITCNNQFAFAFGYDSQQQLESIPLLDCIGKNDHTLLKRLLQQTSRSESIDPEKYTVVGRRIDNIEFPLTLQLTPTYFHQERCIQLIAHPAEANDNQASQPHTSNNTLDQSELFLEELSRFLELRDANQRSALLFIELDDFQSVKESVGIAGSDQALREASRLLCQMSNNQHLISRFSSDVFVMLTTSEDADFIDELAESIRIKLSNYTIDLPNRTITLTCSIGIAMLTDEIHTSEIALSRADVACTIARKEGGNQYHIYDAAQDKTVTDEIDFNWVSTIREALANDHFHLAYQPIVSLHANPEEKYEVLVRLESARGESILPNQFLYAAQQADLIPQIDRWIIQHAFKTITENSDQNKALCLFIKLSAETIKDPNFIPWLHERTKEWHIAPQSIVFELSENTVLKAFNETKTALTQLKKLGYTTALEHFGVHPQVTDKIEQFNIDYLKIAGTFAKNITSNRENQIKVKQIMEVARKLNKYTIAGFVQDAESLAFLWQEGVNYIQGYYLQPPEQHLNYDFSGQA